MKITAHQMFVAVMAAVTIAVLIGCGLFILAVL